MNVHMSMCMHIYNMCVHAYVDERRDQRKGRRWSPQSSQLQCSNSCRQTNCKSARVTSETYIYIYVYMYMKLHMPVRFCVFVFCLRSCMCIYVNVHVCVSIF